MLSLMRSSPAGLIIIDEQRHPIMVSPTLCTMTGRPQEQLLACDCLQVFAPEEQSEVAHRLQTQRQCNHPYPSQVLRPDGSRRLVDTKHFPLEVEGRHLTAMVLLDVTEERLLLSKLGTLSQFVSSLTYAGSLKATLDRLCQKVVENAEAVACSIVLQERRDGQACLSLGGSHGLEMCNKAVVEKALNSGYPLPARQSLETGQTIIERNVQCRLQRFLEGSESPPVLELAKIGREQAWSTVVSVPVNFNGQAVAALSCYYARDAVLGGAETTFLQTLADLAAVAIENARLVTQAEEKATLEERQRLARELHDSVAQAIYGISLGIKTAIAQLEIDPTKVQSPLDYALDLAEGATKEMRALIFSLRPETLDEEGLVRALERHVEALRARYHLDVETAFVNEPHLGSQSRHALFRVAVEALHNVVKHSRASTVRISLCGAPRTCSLEVTDDGVGFDTAKSYPGHLGLRSMKERIEAIGGSFTMHSGKGQGTRLLARVPLEAGASGG